MSASLAPGQWVRLTAAPEWGLGQVQSVAGDRVTVNFEHAGKRLIQADVAKLETVDPAPENTR
jgi:FKBP-type peptidyl-prolyl cis-trans isomerase 2